MLDFLKSFLSDFLYLFPAVVIALTFHEFSHGFAAYKLGDPTAKTAGRLSLNPFHHLSLIGTLCLFFFRFGWAKPVPVNMYYFKNPKTGMAITAAAGPVANLLLAFISTLLWRLTMFLPFYDKLTPYLPNFFYMLVILNINLGIFNLIPFPPLDGSKIIGAFLPRRAYETVMRYEQYAMPVLMLLLWFGVLTKPLSYLSSAVFNAFAFVANKI